MFEWDFSKLPEFEKEGIKEALERSDTDYLYQIYKKYKLSDYKYCCSVDEPMYNWFSHAIENDLI